MGGTKNDFEDAENNLGDAENSLADAKNGFADTENSFGDAGNGFEDAKNNFERRETTLETQKTTLRIVFSSCATNMAPCPKCGKVRLYDLQENVMTEREARNGIRAPAFSRSMPEVAVAGEDHRHARGVGGGDDFLVPN